MALTTEAQVTWLEPEDRAYPAGGQTRKGLAFFPDGRTRRVWAGIPDTYFSIPAHAQVNGRYLAGYLSTRDDGELEFRVMKSHIHVWDEAINGRITRRNARLYLARIIGARDFADKRQKGGALPTRDACDRGFADAELTGSAGYTRVENHLVYEHPRLGRFTLRRPTLLKYTIIHEDLDGHVEEEDTYPNLPAAVATLRRKGLET